MEPTVFLKNKSLSNVTSSRLPHHPLNFLIAFYCCHLAGACRGLNGQRGAKEEVWLVGQGGRNEPSSR